MEHEEWVDNVWALSTSKRDEEYEFEQEGERDYYGYRPREGRAATAAEPRDRAAAASPRL